MQHTFFSLLLLLELLVDINAGYLRTLRFCRSPNVCVDVFQCPAYKYLLPKQPGARLSYTVLRQIRKSFCGASGRRPQVCCTMPQTTTTTTTTSPKDDVESVEWEQLQYDLSQHANYPLLPLAGCGSITNNLRITYGVEARAGEFPWMSLIAYRADGNDIDGDFRCAGTLINERYVLTAAHCIDHYSILGVRLGEHDLSTERDCDRKSKFCSPPVQDVLINKIKIHPRYDPSTYVNDIALIRLEIPANFTNENIKPICLPVGDLQYLDLIDKRMTVAGWGVTEEGDNSLVLKKAWVPLISVEKCRRIYGEQKPITDRQICAGGYKGRDSCAGDSGGPLMFVDMVQKSARYVQYGIVSYGPKQCGVEGRPGIYTNVKEYMHWILDSLEA